MKYGICFKYLALVCLSLFSLSGHSFESRNWSKTTLVGLKAELTKAIRPFQDPKNLDKIPDLEAKLIEIETLSYVLSFEERVSSWKQIQRYMLLSSVITDSNSSKEIDLIQRKSSVSENTLLNFTTSFISNIEALITERIFFADKFLQTASLRALHSTIAFDFWSKLLVNATQSQDYLARTLLKKTQCFSNGEEKRLTIQSLTFLKNLAPSVCAHSSVTVSKLNAAIESIKNSIPYKQIMALDSLRKRGIEFVIDEEGYSFLKTHNGQFHTRDFQGAEVQSALHLEDLGDTERKNVIIRGKQVFLPPLNPPKSLGKEVFERLRGNIPSVSYEEFLVIEEQMHIQDKRLEKILTDNGLSYDAKNGLQNKDDLDVQLTLTDLNRLLVKGSALPGKITKHLAPWQKASVIEVLIRKFTELHSPRKRIAMVGTKLVALPPTKGPNGLPVVALMTVKNYNLQVKNTQQTFEATVEEMDKYLVKHEGFKGTYAQYWTKVSEDFNLVEKTSRDGKSPRRTIFNQQVAILKLCLKRLESLGVLEELKFQKDFLNLTLKQAKAYKELIPFLESRERDVESLMTSSVVLVPLVSGVAVIALAKLPVIALVGLSLGLGIESGRQVVQISVDGSRKEMSLQEIYQSGVTGTALSVFAPLQSLRPLLIGGGSLMALNTVVNEIKQEHYGTAAYDGVVTMAFLGLATKNLTKKVSSSDPKGGNPPKTIDKDLLSKKEWTLLKLKEGARFSELSSLEKNQLLKAFGAPQANAKSSGTAFLDEVQGGHVQSVRYARTTSGTIERVVIQEETLPTYRQETPRANLRTRITPKEAKHLGLGERGDIELGELTPKELQKLEGLRSHPKDVLPQKNSTADAQEWVRPYPSRGTTADKGAWNPSPLLRQTGHRPHPQEWKTPVSDLPILTEVWVAPKTHNSTAPDANSAHQATKTRQALSSTVLSFENVRTLEDGSFEVIITGVVPPEEEAQNSLLRPRDVQIQDLRKALSESTSPEDLEARKKIMLDAYEDSLDEEVQEAGEILRISMRLTQLAQKSELKLISDLRGADYTEALALQARGKELLDKNYLSWFGGKTLAAVNILRLDGGNLKIDSLNSQSSNSPIDFKSLAEVLAPGTGFLSLDIEMMDDFLDSDLLEKVSSLKLYTSSTTAEKKFFKKLLAKNRPLLTSLDLNVTGNGIGEVLTGRGLVALPNLNHLNIKLHGSGSSPGRSFGRLRGPTMGVLRNSLGEESLLSRLKSLSVTCGDGSDHPDFKEFLIKLIESTHLHKLERFGTVFQTEGRELDARLTEALTSSQNLRSLKVLELNTETTNHIRSVLNRKGILSLLVTGRFPLESGILRSASPFGSAETLRRLTLKSGQNVNIPQRVEINPGMAVRELFMLPNLAHFEASQGGGYLELDEATILALERTQNPETYPHLVSLNLRMVKISRVQLDRIIKGQRLLKRVTDERIRE